MNYFVVDATVTIGGIGTRSCKVGSMNSANDYKPNYVKGHIRSFYQRKHTTEKFAIVIRNVTQVTEEQYFNESVNFLQ